LFSLMFFVMSQNEGPDCRICVKQLVILAQLGTDREDA